MPGVLHLSDRLLALPTCDFYASGSKDPMKGRAPSSVAWMRSHPAQDTWHVYRAAYVHDPLKPLIFLTP
jgi:hypothetical protein